MAQSANLHLNRDKSHSEGLPSVTEPMGSMDSCFSNAHDGSFSEISSGSIYIYREALAPLNLRCLPM